MINTHSIWFGIFVDILFYFGVFLAFTSLLIFISPKYIQQLSLKMNRWIDTSNFSRVVDSPHQSERLFYRHHRIAGALLFTISAYILYLFLFVLNAHEIDKVIQKLIIVNSKVVTEWIISSVIFIIEVVSFITLIISVVVFFRPSLLKQAERTANVWVSSDEVLKKLDRQYDLPDQIFTRHPRLFATVILAGALMMIFSAGLFKF